MLHQLLMIGMSSSRTQFTMAVGLAFGLGACSGGAAAGSSSDANGGIATSPKPTSAGSDATGGAGALSASSGGSASASSGGSASAGSGGSTSTSSGGSASASSGGQGTTMECRDSAGAWLPEMKACDSDADCLAVATYSCCGAGVIVGLSKTAPEYKACLTTAPPANCGNLGCASFPSTEDNLGPLQLTDLPSVVARCYELEAGGKACMTTVSGSCVDHGTRCVMGDTCQDACAQTCTCEQGFMVCAPPANGQHCSMPQSVCFYQTAANTRLGCTCTADGAWACQ